MSKAVVFICIVAVTGAIASGVVVDYDLTHHEHTQTGKAGHAVTGSYSFIASDGIEHTVRYIADERGYRVLGESVPEPPPPAPAVSYIPVLAHSLPHVPYHKTPVTHPIQYIPVGVHTPTTNKVEYVKLAGSDLIYVFDGIKYVPVKGNKKSEGVHMHPNVVYSLIK